MDDIRHIQIMHYMGNKRAILQNIVPLILRHSDPNKHVVDLFSGTGAVSYALKPYRQMFTNDMQHYSQVINATLLRNKEPVDLKSLLQQITPLYHQNQQELERLFGSELKQETLFLQEATANHFNLYQDFVKNQEGVLLDSNFIKERKENATLFPYMLFTAYYSHNYYSLRQCVDIDSLRFAIHSIKDSYNHSFLLTALLMTIGCNLASSTGHFAQYRNLNSFSSYKQIARRRNKDVWTIFCEKTEELQEELNQTVFDNQFNQSFQGDYLDFLNDKEKMKQVSHVYADPPYTEANYSRFYHIPETLVLYDYPSLSTNKNGERLSGRYREDRHQSTFCKHKEARQSFEELISTCAKYNLTLSISYSDNGILPTNEIEDLLRQYFSFVEIYTFPYVHHKYGREGLLSLNEYLFISHNEHT